MLVAPALMRIFGLGELEELATGLSRVLFPVVVFLGVSGIVVGSSTPTKISPCRRSCR